MKFLKGFAIVLLVIAIICGGIFLINQNNKKQISDYIDTFEPVEYGDQLTPEKDELGNYFFTTDEDFKILHLTDVHLGGGFLFAENDKKALNAVAAMVTAEMPDLVVITGDISFAVPWSGTLNNSYAHGFFKQLMERLGVYWTVTFGNHDSENYNIYNREKTAQMYLDESLEYCLFTPTAEGVYGESNLVINVRNSVGLYTESIIMIDSNAYTEDDIFGIGWSYDNVHADQIEWYRETVEEYTARNREIYESLGEDERPLDFSLDAVKSLLFMHIPIKEVRDAYYEYMENENQSTLDTEYMWGEVGEPEPFVYCPEEDEELFETILELGSTDAVFFGHDHLNNIVLDYKGVTFSYGYSIDYSAYAGIANIGYQRGCTVINLGGNREPEIIHENYYQDKYTPLYEKESVKMTKD